MPLVDAKRHRIHRFAAVQRVIGVLLMIFSVTMLPPVAVSHFYDNAVEHAFLTAMLVTLSSGALLWWPVRNGRSELKIRDGFLVVVLFWVVLGVYGAIPFYIAPRPEVTIAQAVFESISGLTTTGATVLVGIEHLPEGIRYYRQQLQWLGGMGIVVLAVAILPMLGIGGMQLYKAETPGPVKDNKLTPRIVETARALWIIYFGLTVSCAVAYQWAGMSWFDAIGHSFSTVAIGGFSTYDASMGHFNSTLIEGIAVIFMILAAANFSLHFAAWRARSFSVYRLDPEFRAFILTLAGLSVVASALLFGSQHMDFGESLITGLFQVVSYGTTTGYTTADITHWPSFLPAMLLLASFIGGCAHSTAGGMKVVRVMLVFKQGIREVVRLIHPSAEIPVKLGNKVVSREVVQAVWGFTSIYMGFFVLLLIAMLATGLDLVTAFAAVAACLNNLGPGLGEVSSNFAGMNDVALWIGTYAMLLGRLELFPLLVLMTPYFWRR